ncbi:transposase [Streptomyces violaceusniger]|uniref:transposase n=1 Tax=Streptomyces violaceusniger TaxID=68280 RepID=UPI00341887E1
MPDPRKYPLELRDRAVRMYRAAEPKPVIRRMAEELGVHHEALRDWIRQAEADAGERDDPSSGTRCGSSDARCPTTRAILPGRR